MESKTTMVDARVPRRFNTAAAASTSSNSKEGPVKSSTIAERADALAVYEDAVQEPALECGNLASLYYNAQIVGSRRPEARILREDFASSAIVAQTWNALEEGKRRAQGVDVDLEALEVARRRATRPGSEEGQIAKRVVLLQSGQLYGSEQARVLEDKVNGVAADEQSGSRANGKEDEQMGERDVGEQTTWAIGATSDRFERRFQARLQRKRREEEQRAARKKKEEEKETLTNADEDDLTGVPALTLMHADVLSLPLCLAPGTPPVPAPDIVYAGNYALSYFHTRSQLLAYLSQVARTLRRDTGCLIVDPFAGPTSWASDPKEQQVLWSRFCTEPGFLRGPEDPPAPVSDDAPLQFWSSDSLREEKTNGSADWRKWPRGNLVKVRSGALFGGYDYYREDSPLDHATNRFRMSLSFRFKGDGSWLRDYFSYDFRVWSILEIKEAMEEVGLRHIEVHAIERGEDDDDNSEKDAEEGKDQSDDDDDEMGGDFALLTRTEKNEAGKKSFRHLKADNSEKLFATRSFGTYIVARAPAE